MSDEDLIADDLEAEQGAQLDERQLLAILRSEHDDASSYYSSELALAQAEGMDRYYGRPYGDEVEGRSKVVTHDIEDTVNWIMPQLMRMFLQNRDLVMIEDDSDEDTRKRNEDAAAYLSHVVFKKNEGEKVLHDFAFDALVQRVGVVRIQWEDPRPKPPDIYEGVLPEQLAEMDSDPSYEILESEQAEDGTFAVKVQHTPRNGQCSIEAVAPEAFRISRRATSIEAADYHSYTDEIYLAELIREYPDSADEIRTGQDHEDVGGLDEDPRRQARFADESYDFHSDLSHHEARRKVELVTEYIRIDYDGDGVVELRCIKRLGNTILENIQVDESEFRSWSPIRVAHRFTGRSLTDTLLDIQKIRTVLTRRLLDGLSQSLSPRTLVNKQKVQGDAIDQLLDQDIGDVIEIDGDPRDAVDVLVTPDVSGSVYQALEYHDQRSEEASGVTRHAQGLKAEAITDTMGGIGLLQAAANARIELVARWLVLGVEGIFNRAMKLIAAHQDHVDIIKVNGRPVEINPTAWTDDMRVSVHVGVAAESRADKLQKLNLIAEKQEQILLQAGPSNPIVSLKEYRETLAAMTIEAGFRSPEVFFKELPEDYEPPAAEEQPDPKVLEVQGKQQLAEAELQTKTQLQQAELINKRELEQIKIQGEREVAALRMEAEKEIAIYRANLENELARWKAEMDDERQRDLAKYSNAAKPEANGSGVRMGGQIG